MNGSTRPQPPRPHVGIPFLPPLRDMPRIDSVDQICNRSVRFEPPKIGAWNQTRNGSSPSVFSWWAHNQQSTINNAAAFAIQAMTHGGGPSTLHSPLRKTKKENNPGWIGIRLRDKKTEKEKTVSEFSGIRAFRRFCSVSVLPNLGRDVFGWITVNEKGRKRRGGKGRGEEGSGGKGRGEEGSGGKGRGEEGKWKKRKRRESGGKGRGGIVEEKEEEG
ncbi:hypothetical protein H6P81_007841 [Aristolochia fimbriata]|uniref:Uncharacterized protein n=1 Tax=Aristolochia fimbriata TaxID=158543 RepID=A0AAV7F572_ARIFI|nr:hypothetical protein H6P81_007841 [Aristolochia fimbriata]